MKDFIKWLGVNEKIAKVVVWIFIIMIMLITVNAALTSLGFPHYAITYDNLIKINFSKFITVILDAVISILNFYTIMLLVFRIKETKRLFKYSILYYIGNITINYFLGYGCLQIYIFLFTIIFCYLYSGRKWKYIIYGLLSLVFTTLMQGIWYLFKGQNINYGNLSDSTKMILSIDYFIIMAIIILVKEIYLKKRGERICGDAGYGSENSKTKTNLQKRSQKKSQVQLNSKKRIK